MTLKLVYAALKGDFQQAFNAKYEPVAIAATNAINVIRADFEREARQNIAQAGFSRRWQRGYRVRKLPKGRKPAIDVAALGRHSIFYANIFERGGVIHGKPLLWLPLPTTPKKIGREKISPRVYAARIGPLQYVSRPGKAPLLLAKKGGRGKTTLASLRRGAAGGASVSVPLFVGLKQVTIPSKFDISSVAERVAATLSEIYAREFAAVNR